MGGVVCMLAGILIIIFAFPDYLRLGGYGGGKVCTPVDAVECAADDTNCTPVAAVVCDKRDTRQAFNGAEEGTAWGWGLAASGLSCIGLGYGITRSEARSRSSETAGDDSHEAARKRGQSAGRPFHHIAIAVKKDDSRRS